MSTTSLDKSNKSLATFAFGLLLPSNKPTRSNGRIRLAIMLFVFSAVVFRSEIALLLGTNALWLLIIPQISLHRLIPPFAVSFLLSLTISVAVDSYFWQKWLWPELWGFVYNVVQGSASDWGTSPWHYYFRSAIPKLLLNPITPAFIYMGLQSSAYSRLVQRLLIPNLLFVAIYSLQPHKEARFIFYVVPPLTAAAALGATSLITSAKRSTNTLLQSLTTPLLSLTVVASFVASAGMLLASALNYPGGEALAALHQLVRTDQATAGSALVTVHADVLSCMTGVTLFGVAGGDNVPTRHNFLANENAEMVVAGSSDVKGDETAPKPSTWLQLDKTEDAAVLSDPSFWLRFDYLLMENEEAIKGGQWDTVAVVEGLAPGVEILRPGMPTVQSEPVGIPRVGRAALLTAAREHVRALTGGWWVGPRLAPRIRILRRVNSAVADQAARETVAAA